MFSVVLSTYLPLFLFCFVVVYCCVTRYRPGLRGIPGPWLASFTNAWRAYAVYCGRFDLTNRALHAKYGNLVRVGPNCVSVQDPREIPKIYGIQRIFPKSDYYSCSEAIAGGKRVAGLFQTRDEAIHKAAKRPIANAYAMTTLMDYEPLVDSTSAMFIERLQKLFVATGQVCPFDRWLQWYAFDVIGEITFSRRLGFLELAKDANDMISILNKAGWYTAVVGQMPWLDTILEKNWFIQKFFPPRKNQLPHLVLKIMQDRLAEDAHSAKMGEAGQLRRDFLSKFTQAAENAAGKIPPQTYLGWAMSNINAGSDTTAISLRAIFYYLLRTPRALNALQTELEHAHLSDFPQFKETRNLPYLSAVIKEALRLHTPVGLILERIVPEGGVSLAGHLVPEGAIVGCNPFVIHRSEAVYGKQYDVDEFWPERWTEPDETTKTEMERYYMAFGSGKRICLGRNISLLEIYKLVPLLLIRFKISLVHPEKEWKVWDTFFVHQSGVDVYLEDAEQK